MLFFFANIPPCLIGMEAFISDHFWANKLMPMGHSVKLIVPQFVKPYVKTNKYYAADVEVICEVVTRPDIQFVLVSTVEQQNVLALHRSRQNFIKQRTVQGNNRQNALCYRIGKFSGIGFVASSVLIGATGKANNFVSG